MKIDFTRLTTAVDWSNRQLETYRKNRIEAIRQYVGNHYTDGGADKRVPTNFLELATTIYVRQLAARAPRAIITTHTPALKPYARAMELAINQVPDEINLGSTLRRAVIEAMFAFGIVKVGICASGETVLGHDPGKPFADLVNIDNYVVDMTAKTRESIQFEGDEYWLPVDDVRAMYNDSSIEPDKHTNQGEHGQSKSSEVSSDENGEVYKDRVWLRDIYLPSENKLLTYAISSKKLLNTVDWDGSDHGPYHIISFSEVPGNLLPLPPVALWIDLHELGNTLFRKLGRQADAKKTVAAFSGGNDEDVESLKKAADGEGIRYTGQRPDAITVGGIDAPTLAFYLQIRDLFSYFAGNLDSLGGLAPMTETVGQDRLLSEAASSRLKQMAETTIDFARGIFKQLAWYEWTDPIRERVVRKPVRGTNIAVKRTWSMETREGDFLDYNFDVDVYSMQDDSPSTKLQKIGTILNQYVFPLLPLVQQQGGQIDIKKLVDLLAQFGNIPELVDIIRFMDPADMPPMQGDPNPSMTFKPAETKRTYERINRPGATRHGKDDVMSRLLMGGGVQPSESAAMGRMVS